MIEEELESLRYHKLQEEQQRAWEKQCRRCGMCCGVKEGDPCQELGQQDNGEYFCYQYANRFGPRRTRSGREFFCVPLRDILHEAWPGSACCGYRQKDFFFQY